MALRLSPITARVVFRRATGPVCRVRRVVGRLVDWNSRPFSTVALKATYNTTLQLCIRQHRTETLRAVSPGRIGVGRALRPDCRFSQPSVSLYASLSGQSKSPSSLGARCVTGFLHHTQGLDPLPGLSAGEPFCTCPTHHTADL